jgi:hypothetical protein
LGPDRVGTPGSVCVIACSSVATSSDDPVHPAVTAAAKLEMASIEIRMFRLPF